MNWEKGQEGRTRISANNRKLLREAVRTPEEMVEFLKSGAEFRSFDYLLRQLYPGEDLMPRLVSGLEKVNGESHDSIARKARNWLNGKNTPKSRELLFQISFVLGLDEFGADRLLACASETGIHYRNPRELAYACALRLDLPYEEADELEKDGIIRTERKNLGADIVRIHYPVSAIPQLCRRVGIEDSRIRQIRWIKTAEKWARGAEGTFLSPYYEILTGRLQSGQEVKKPDMEDEDFFRCLNQIALLETSVWRRQFSAEVLHDSKLFEKKYQSRIVTVLEEYSPLSEEGMSADDILRVHGIRTYSQTLEWKGPLIYRIGNGSLIDSSARGLI